MNSFLLNDYEKYGYLPTIDQLLDWRNRLKELQKDSEYPKEWFDIEIKATDELLKKHNKDGGSG